MSTLTQISCPNCGTQVNVNEILYHQMEDAMKKKFQGEVDEHRQKYKNAITNLKAKELSFQEQQEQFNEKLT